jgi:hypothetical protein
MSRSVPSKLGGVVVLLLSILILLIFPFFFNYKNDMMKDNLELSNLDNNTNKNVNFREENTILFYFPSYSLEIIKFYSTMIYEFFFSFYKKIYCKIHDKVRNNRYAYKSFYYYEIFMQYFKNNFNFYSYAFSYFIVI